MLKKEDSDLLEAVAWHIIQLERVIEVWLGIDAYFKDTWPQSGPSIPYPFVTAFEALQDDIVATSGRLGDPQGTGQRENASLDRFLDDLVPNVDLSVRERLTEAAVRLRSAVKSPELRVFRNKVTSHASLEVATGRRTIDTINGDLLNRILAACAEFWESISSLPLPEDLVGERLTHIPSLRDESRRLTDAIFRYAAERAAEE